MARWGIWLVVISAYVLSACQSSEVGRSSQGFSPGRPSFEPISRDTTPAFPFLEPNATTDKPETAVILRMGHAPRPCAEKYCQMQFGLGANKKVQLFVAPMPEMASLFSSVFMDFPTAATLFDTRSGNYLTVSGREYAFMSYKRGNLAVASAMAEFSDHIYLVKILQRTVQTGLSQKEHDLRFQLKHYLEDIAVAQSEN